MKTFLQSTSDYDIVLLQEVWLASDFEMIGQLVRDAFPFSHHFNAGIIGSGTCIFTKVQLQDANFHEFAMNGYPTSVRLLGPIFFGCTMFLKPWAYRLLA